MHQMNQTLFSGLKGTHNPHRWVLNVAPMLTVGLPGREFLFGGAGLGACVRALERTSGRPLIWATAQYLSFAGLGAHVDIDVEKPVHGRNTTQARAIGHVGDQEIFSVNAALGERPGDVTAAWAKPPQVPMASECPRMPRFRTDGGVTLHEQFDVRVAKGRYGEDRTNGGISEDGQAILWVRHRDGLPVTADLLAVIADYVPSATGHALGRKVFVNSLDNTLRIHRVQPTDWVLCDIRIQGVHAGFAHGLMTMFTEDGGLLANASQSGIIRFVD